MQVFNGCMVGVLLGRTKIGEMFDDLFMQRMKDKYEKKKTASNHKHGVEAAASHEDRDDFILSNFNIESYMSGIVKKTITMIKMYVRILYRKSK
jgi:hypothetical protein